MEQKTILLVDDNQKILDANRRILSREGYLLRSAASLAEARRELEEHPPDLVVLDVMLPDGNGLDFLQELREVSIAPVLLLTSLSDRDHRLNGLRAGGDDYITKPYDLEELKERVAAALRRSALQERSVPRAILRGPLKLDPVAGRAWLDGRDLGLTPKEFSLLMYLARHSGSPLPAEQIYREVWGQPMGEDVRTLRKHISRLKGKLETAGGGASLMATRGQGYELDIME